MSGQRTLHTGVFTFTFSPTRTIRSNGAPTTILRENSGSYLDLSPVMFFFFAHEIKKKKQNTDITGDINIANARTNFSYLATITASLSLSFYHFLSLSLSFSFCLSVFLSHNDPYVNTPSLRLPRARITRLSKTLFWLWQRRGQRTVLTTPRRVLNLI